MQKFSNLVPEKFEINKRKTLILFALFLVSFIPILLLFKPGLPITDDGTWLVIRFSAFYETLRTGQFPVRFIYRLNDGMGYPVSNFLYPLYLYLAVPIHVLGFSFLNSIKILLIVNIFFSSFFTFFWLNKKFNDTSSFLGSVVLILSPYYLFDLYKRGSVGELLTFSIVPFILWQIERKSLVLLSLGFFLLIISHNTLGFLFLMFIAIYVLANKINIKSVALPFVLGFGMSAFFWLPALYDLSSTVFLNTKVSSFYDYLFKQKDLYLIGISSVFIIFASIYLLLFQRIKIKSNAFFLISIILSILIIFIQFPQSRIFWEIFPLKDFIQFPFRLLSLLIILLSFQAAFTANGFKKNKWFYTSILVVLLFLQSFVFLNKISFQNYEDSFYSTNQSTTTITNEYLTKWYKIPSGVKNDKIEIVSGEGKILDNILYPRDLNFIIQNNNPVEIRVNILYFPGWSAVVNGKEVKINYEKDGLIHLNLSPEENRVSLEFKETKIRNLANLFSIISFLILIAISLVNLSYLINKRNK